MRPLRHPVVQAGLARLLAGYLRLALRTIRWRSEGGGRAEGVWAAGGGVIVCLQHGRIALAPACWPAGRAQPPRVLVSLSADGGFVAAAMERLGFPAIRGSTGKRAKSKAKSKGGAAAFRETLRWIRGGGGVAITPDGPRGPPGSMTDGPPLLARASGAPVLLVGMAVRPCLRLRSWDGQVVPLPFGRGLIVWDGPLSAGPVSAGPLSAGRDDAVDGLREEWRARLQAVTDRAEAQV